MKGWKGFDPKADPYTSVEMAEKPTREEEIDEAIIHSYPYPRV
jgi:hypothetical protein